MSGVSKKQPDLRAAVEKAVGHDRTALLAGNPRRKPQRKSPGPDAMTLEQATKEIARLEKELGHSRLRGREMEKQRAETQKLLAEKTVSHKRVAARLDSDDKIFTDLRRAIGAGKDAKAADLPRRIADLMTRIGTLDAARSQAEEQGADLRQLHEDLRLRHEAAQSELAILRTAKSSADARVQSGNRITVETHAHRVEPEEAWSQDEEIVPTYFTRFVSSEPIDVVKARYAAWVLGLDPYAKSRSARVSLGVDRAWAVHDLLEAPPIELTGANGARVSARSTEDGWVVRFVHSDGRFEGTQWLNLARLSSDEEGTRIEHALIRLTGARAHRPGTMDSVPNVLKDLFKTAPVPWVWEDYSGNPKLIHGGNAQTFVDGVLLHPERRLPVVVVSRTAHGDEFIVDPKDLSKALLGIAVVFVVDEKCSFVLSDAMRESGIPDALLGCYDGGVRMYLPSFHPGTDPYKHILWTRSFLEGRQEKERARLIARKIALHTVDLLVPAGFARLIEDHDLKVAAEFTSSTAAEGDLAAQVGALKAEVQALQEHVESLRKEAQQVPTLRAALRDRDQKISYRDELIDMVNIETETIRAEKVEMARQAHNFKAQLAQAEEALKSASAGLTFDVELLDGVLREGKVPSVGAFVRLLGARYPDRLVLLPTALTSAQECTYQPQEKATELLYLLATDYYEALMRGECDQEAAKVFGRDGFAPDESDNLSRAGEKARTFTYEGRSVTMLSHLKITKGFERSSSNKVFRTHFSWDAQRKVIVIGHIGRHLPD